MSTISKKMFDAANYKDNVLNETHPTITISMPEEDVSLRSDSPELNLEFSLNNSLFQNKTSFNDTTDLFQTLEIDDFSQNLTRASLNITSKPFHKENRNYLWTNYTEKSNLTHFFNLTTSFNETSSNSYNFTNFNNLTQFHNFTENSSHFQEELTHGFGFNGSFFSDISTNFTFNSSIEYPRVLSNDSLATVEGFLNFDVVTWLTLMPQNIPENGAGAPGDTNDTFPLVICKVLILALISLVGCLGNILVIWSVVKESHLHRPPFYFLLSLGVTDLSRAVFCLPVVITTVLNGSKWRHGESACKLFAFATSFFVFSSALSLLAIAIDRHISIVYSKTYRRRSLGIANLIAAIIIWIIAFSVSFPPVVGIGDYVFIPEEAQCSYQHKSFRYNDSVSSVLVFVAILFLTFFLYFRIFRFLRAHRRMRPLQHTPAVSSNWAFVGPGANGQAFINWLNGFGGQVPVRQGGQRAVQRLNFGRVVNLSTAKNEHLTRIFLILTFVFGITWFPYVILSIWRIFFDSLAIPAFYVTVSAWLGYGQIALCPVIYLMIKGNAKKPAKTLYAQAEKREFLLENKMGK